MREIIETYLVVTAYDGPYPTEHLADFEAEEHTLATCDDATPLLWLAMFRPADLRSGTVTGDGRTVTAPAATRQQALTHLYAAVPVLDGVLGGSVEDHAELLREAMRWLPDAYVTIEWWDEDRPGGLPDRGELSRALAAFDDATAQDVGNQDALARLSGIRRGAAPPPASLLVDAARVDAEERRNLEHLLGRSHMRMVPWETPI